MRDRKKEWQKLWEEGGSYRTQSTSSPKRYVLAMFPYPSGKLHMGHVRNYTLSDAYARYSRMKGFDVLHPMGWDSFGLPAENAAEKRETNPADWIEKCISRMKEEMKNLGFSYDWDREFQTSQSEVYKWTQWIFLQMYENGLVDRKKATLNWCPECNTVLADAQVETEDELCWRCDTPVQDKRINQWFLKTTEYSEELLNGLDDLDDWPENVVEQQRNWIDGEGDDYNLQDWLISRQRYWGTPIPLVECDECGYVPVEESDLPIQLPEKFESTAGNPIEQSESFKRCQCPECGRNAERETDTMDTFVDSSWYFLQFAMNSFSENPIESPSSDEWMPVDKYIGGVEHATTHLLYARFIMHALSDMGYTEYQEPFKDLETQGMVLLDGDKMSKSRGNVVNPSEIVDEFGADTARWFICDAAAPESDFNWDDEQVQSCSDLINKISNLLDSDPVEGSGDIDEMVEGFCSDLVQNTETYYEEMRYHKVTTEVREKFSILKKIYRSGRTSEDSDRLIRQSLCQVIYPIVPHVSEDVSSHTMADNSWRDVESGLNTKYMSNVLEDLRDVINVVEPDGIEEVNFSVCESWKYSLYNYAQRNNAESVSEIMSEFGERGENGAETARRVIEDEIPVSSAEEEIRYLNALVPYIEEQYGCSVNVYESDKKSKISRPDIHIVEQN